MVHRGRHPVRHGRGRPDRHSPARRRDQSPPDTPRKFPQTPRFVRGAWEQIDGDRGLLTVLVGDGLVRPYYSPFVRDWFRFVRDSLPVVKSSRRPGDPIPIPFSFPTAVAAFGVSPGGRTWAVGDTDGTITVFPAPTPTDLGLSVPHPGAGAVYGVGFVADGGIVSQAQNLSVAAGPPDQPTTGLDSARPRRQFDFYGAMGPAAGLISSHDGRWSRTVSPKTRMPSRGSRGSCSSMGCRWPTPRPVVR